MHFLSFQYICIYVSLFLPTPSSVQILVILDMITYTKELLNIFYCHSYPYNFTVSTDYPTQFSKMPPKS
jgi:hypothetical protein